MVTIDNVITNSGDGSNSVQWVTDAKVIERMTEMADAGYEAYSSGDGIQVSTLIFPEGFDLKSWVLLNHIYLVTLEDLEELEDLEDLE